MSSLISPDQLSHAFVYLEALEKNSRLRGETYWHQGRVVKLIRGEDENHIYATVRGSELYQVSLYFEGEVWAGTCTCMVGDDCKHCCAAMLAAVDEANKSPRTATAKPKSVSKSDSKVAAATFTSIMRTKLGRALKGDEQRAAQAVDAIYKKSADAQLITESAFDEIRLTHSVWSWESVAAWPSRPESPWEAWLYMAALFRRRGWRCPPAFLEVTDWQEVQKLVGPWELELRVDKWNDWLHKAANVQDEPIARTSIPLRVRLTQKGVQLEWRKTPTGDFTDIRPTPFKLHFQEGHDGRLPFEPSSLPLWNLFCIHGAAPFQSYTTKEARRILNAILRLPGFEERIVNSDGLPFRRPDEVLAWSATAPNDPEGDYSLNLVLPDGSTPRPIVFILEGEPSLLITPDAIYSGPRLAGLDIASGPIAIPAAALETREGLSLFDRLELQPPERIAAKIRTVTLRAVFKCTLERLGKAEYCQVIVRAETEDGALFATYRESGWFPNPQFQDASSAANVLVRYNRSALRFVPTLLEELRVIWEEYGRACWSRQCGKHFPETFTQWYASLPPDPHIVVEVDRMLGTLRDQAVSARVSLDIQESGIDWFDLRVALDVSDTHLTPEEIQLLLDARGGFVRLGEKGWRRMEFHLSEEDEQQLADVGLSARDFKSGPQRLHALQLAGKKAATRMLPEAQAFAIERRVQEIRTRVTPDVPAELLATLRPYQISGFHFLAYLAENRFGGILADDMGLGKTVQTLAWLLWIRAQPGFAGLPSLVICPKSVTDNWVAEVNRFAPGLTVRMLPRGGCDLDALNTLREGASLLVANYTQLRLVDALTAVPWHAAILDEAQYIKNPQSQTAQCALMLNAGYRIALSGTPIENRLLDLWSIMNFVMPGVLGGRASFSRNFDQRVDTLARRRLSARVRPFVIRRTKREVASDLPERTEEDLLCEMEGGQLALYNAELKRARVALLKIKTSAQLDKARFSILTSLLRLRQICCHPALLASEGESAKLAALMDLLEPLMEEGQKVLVFSQFVEMLKLIREEVVGREWKEYMLTGDTEDRGALVKEFQECEGSAVFLISLRAGGFGLNLTAASYVVLYDPWWNPAVENQAIDRTHRIGQKNEVIAYRLIIKESIEEKIRALQKQKRALAEDILGEENFNKALSLDDFRFLLEG